VLIPEENRKDLKDVPEAVLEQLVVHPVKHMDEVLRYALAHPQPEEFLREPSSVVDWRIVETMPPTDQRDAH
jgi:ATP-dependent Lon protease